MIYNFFQNYPDVRLSTCPYNATHLMPKDEMKGHMERCLDRRIVEVQKYNVPLPGQHGYLRNPTVYGSSFIKSNSNEEAENQDQDKAEVESTMSSMSSLNRSRILRNVLTRNAPRPIKSSALNDSTCSREIQRINKGASIPRKILRRPNSIEEPLQYVPSPLVGRVESNPKALNDGRKMIFSTTPSLISNDPRGPLPLLPSVSSPNPAMI